MSINPTSSSSSSSLNEPWPSEELTNGLLELYSRFYWEERTKIIKSDSILHLLLTEWKQTRPEIFRSYLRVTSDCFDALIEAIRDDPVFHNNSNNSQTPVEMQTVIALYRFDHYGNAASTMKVALTFGVSYGLVRLATARVMKACCSERFRASSVQWSSADEKELAKEAVANTCPGWRNGWCMVDGTLVPLFQRPSLFGNTWFDRKSNYSMNVQVSTSMCRYLGFRLINSVNRSCRLQTARSLTTESGYLVVNMTLPHGRTHGLLNSMVSFLLKMNGYGQIQPIRFHDGASRHTRSRSCVLS